VYSYGGDAMIALESYSGQAVTAEDALRLEDLPRNEPNQMPNITSISLYYI
jgi:hypothetical protein